MIDENKTKNNLNFQNSSEVCRNEYAAHMLNWRLHTSIVILSTFNVLILWILGMHPQSFGQFHCAHFEIIFRMQNAHEEIL